MAREYTQGKYQLKNPKKYKGDRNNVVFRSSYELKMFTKLDTAKSVLAWNAEEVVIPYFFELDQQWHRYFMDIWYKARTPQGEIIERLVEIKPAVKTRPPAPRKRKTKAFLEEQIEWARNQAKWKAAHKYAKKHGMTFHVFTERELGINK